MEAIGGTGDAGESIWAGRVERNTDLAVGGVGAIYAVANSTVGATQVGLVEEVPEFAGSAGGHA